MDDLISRQAVIDALNVGTELLRRVLDNADIVGVERAKFEWGLGLIESCISDIKDLPSAQPEQKGEWTTEEVAELLFNLFGDDCACNFNGIDEWLPERCKYAEIAEECPSPKEKHGCWMQFLIQGGADMMRGEEE